MRTVTHREMRNNSGEILRAVAAGETVLVTNRGRVAAVIAPPSEPTLAGLVAGGHARPPHRPVSELATIERRASAVSTAEMLDDLRGDR